MLRLKIKITKISTYDNYSAKVNRCTTPLMWLELPA
jgi:hypothetical protein